MSDYTTPTTMSDFTDDFVTILHGDAWELAPTLEPQSIHTIVTSPPYWGLRDYGEPGQFGLEPTPDAYVARLVDLFARLRPALRDDGTVWLNLGDSFARNGGWSDNHGLSEGKARGESGRAITLNNKCPSSLKEKDLVGIPWRVAFALQADGWYLRSDIIWHKPNPMPESVTDRPTKSHEYVFLLSKQARYYYDRESIREPVKESNTGEIKGANKRSVWTVTTKPFLQAHFAVFPPDLIKPCILAGCPEGGTVLDPFMGSGTTAEVARSLGRRAVGFELNADYIDIAAKHRLAQGVLL